MSIKRALVVDDSRLARTALTKLLKKRDMEVEMAGSGGEALDFLRTDQPDVIFLDYMMPDMDGFTAAERIGSLPEGAGIPVVMYTSQDSDEDRARARDLGIRGFLSKPTSEEGLDDVLRDLNGGVAPAAGGMNGVERETPAPEPVAPAVSAAAPSRASLPWEELRAMARDAGEEAATVIAQGIARERLDQLRREMEAATAQMPNTARMAAEQEARNIAEKVARQIAEKVAEQAGKTAAAKALEELKAANGGTDEAMLTQRISNRLRSELDDKLYRHTATEEFRSQVASVVNQHVVPLIKGSLQQWVRDEARQVAKQISEESARSTLETAESRARQLAESVADKRTVEFQNRWGRSVAVGGLVLLIGVVLGIWL